MVVLISEAVPVCTDAAYIAVDGKFGFGFAIWSNGWWLLRSKGVSHSFNSFWWRMCLRLWRPLMERAGPSVVQFVRYQTDSQLLWIFFLSLYSQRSFKTTAHNFGKLSYVLQSWRPSRLQSFWYEQLRVIFFFGGLLFFSCCKWKCSHYQEKKGVHSFGWLAKPYETDFSFSKS